MEKLETSFIAVGIVKQCSHYFTVGKFLESLGLQLACDSPIPLVGIHPREIDTFIDRCSCTIIHNSQKVCPSTYE